MSNIIHEGDGYVIRWYDDAESILMVEIARNWTWEEAHEVVGIVNETLFAADHNVATVYHLANGVRALPRGGAALPNLRRLMLVDPPNEELIVFIGGGTLLRSFMGVVGKTYGLRAIVSKHRFVATLDEALQKVADHRRGYDG